jgi:hypothetical protein
MDFRFNPVCVKPFFQDARIGSGNFLSVEPAFPFVGRLLGNGERKPAFAEAQPFDDLYLFLSFQHFVFADDSHVGRTVGYGLGNVVVTEVKYLHREVLGRRHQVAAADDQADPGLFHQFQRAFIQPAFGLNGYSQYFLHNDSIKKAYPAGKPQWFIFSFVTIHNTFTAFREGRRDDNESDENLKSACLNSKNHNLRLKMLHEKHAFLNEIQINVNKNIIAYPGAFWETLNLRFQIQN